MKVTSCQADEGPEWTCTDGKAKYHFLVVATGASAPSGSPVSFKWYGRVLLLKISRNDQGELDVRQMYGLRHDSPVYCVEQIGPR